jgi:Zn-finger nucleic acid-binding protein
MFVVEYQQVELDYCGNCHGVWFDHGELEVLFAKVNNGTESLINNMLQVEEAASNEPRRKCPICRRTMRKSNVAQQKHVLIDACVQHDGLWFDGGEIDHLVKYLQEGSQEKSSQSEAFNFIKEVLGDGK